MKYDFITIGGATEDITLYTSEGVLIDNHKDVLQQKLLAFEYGAKLKVDKSNSTFGGGAANAAVNFAGLGFRAAAMVAVGEDIRGQAVIKNLKNRRVDTGLIQKIKQQETGFTFFVIGKDGEHVGFSHRAANQSLKIGAKERRALANARRVYITSLSGKWKSVLDQIFKVKNIKVTWNPGGRQIDAGLKAISRYLKKTSILQLNKDEAIEIAMSDPALKNKDNDFLNNPKNLLEILKSYGPEIVVVTSGQDGADAFDGKIFYHQKILKEKKRIDTTGVGDCFGSTFTAVFDLTKGDIKKAMLLGVKNTASVISQQGAQNGLLTKNKLFKK